MDSPQVEEHSIALILSASSEALELVLTDGGAIEWRHAVDRERRAFQFSVGEPGSRSTIWKCLRPKKRDDIYFGSRKSMGEFKFSFHESGVYRLAWGKADSSERDSRGYPSAPGESDPRVLSRWNGKEMDDAGGRRILTALVPFADISDVPGDSEKWEDVTWLPRPSSPSLKTEVSLLQVPPDQVILITGIPPGTNFGVADYLTTTAGEVVVAFWLQSVITDIEAATIQDMRDGMVGNQGQDVTWELDPSTGPRAIFTQVSEIGEIGLWDLSFHPGT